MNNSDRITTINKVLADYFGKHPGSTVKTKDMMCDFIKQLDAQCFHNVAIKMD